MSEAKNTALGSGGEIGYSHVSPTKHRPFQPTHHMISLTLILTALVTLISWDASEAESTTQSIPVESDDSVSLNR